LQSIVIHENIREISQPYVIYYLGDVHLGAANCNEHALKQAVKMIQEDANAWIGMGDYIDAISYNDPRFNPLEIAERYEIRDLNDLPRKQADEFLNIIEPIQNKCIGLISGNHENKYRKYNGFDVNSYLTSSLGVPDLHQKAWISINFRDEKRGRSTPIKIVVCHGTGGSGFREGYPINKVYDIFRWDIADVHVMGHLHQMQTDRCEYNDFSYGTIRRLISWFAINGCFLSKTEEGVDSYFEERPGKESAIGMLRQTIYTHGKRKDLFDIQLQKIYLR